MGKVRWLEIAVNRKGGVVVEGKNFGNDVGRSIFSWHKGASARIERVRGWRIALVTEISISS